MICNANAKNNGKLLAAIVAMLMVMCAVAVVAMPADADGTESAPTFTGNTTVEITEAVTDANIGTGPLKDYYNAETKTLTVPDGGLTIELSADMGTETTPLDLNIVLNGDLKFTSESNNKIFIKTSTLNGEKAGANSGDYTIEFKADDSVIQFDGVTATLNNSVYSLISNMYPGTTSAFYVTGGAVVTLSQDYSGTTWLNSDGNDGKETYLVVTGTADKMSTINFNNTRSIQGFVLDADYANVNVNNSSVTGMVLKAGSTIDNSAVNVNGAGQAGILVKGKITVNNSTIETSGTGSSNSAYPGIEFSIYGNYGLGTGDDAPGIVMDDNSSIDTDSFGFGVEWTSDPTKVTPTAGSEKITISGGSVSGDFQGIRTTTANIEGLQPTYNLDGSTITGSCTNNKGVTLAAAGTEGFTVAGNLRNAGDISTEAAGVTVNGKLTNTADGTIEGSKAISGTGSVIAESGSTISVPVQTPNYENGNAEEVFVYGNSYKTFWYPDEQIVTVPEGQTWTIVKNGIIVIPYMLNVLGDLVLEEGATLVVGAYSGMSVDELTGMTGDYGYGKADIANSLTIENGAKFIVATGEVNVNGEATVDGEVVVGLSAEPAVLNVNSDMTLSEYSTLTQDTTGGKITVAQDVILTVQGTVGSNVTIANSGSIVIDAEPTDDVTNNIVPFTGSFTVNMMADGASVEIRNFAVSNGGSVYVDDQYLKVTNDTTLADYDGKPSLIRFSSSYDGSNFYDSVISGLTVVEDFSYDRAKKEVTSSMEISGSVSAGAIGDSENMAAYIYLVNGAFSVPDTDAENDLALGEDVTLNNAADLTVSGYVPVNKDATIINGNEITLAGNGHIYMVETPTNEIADKINAAHYITTVGTDDYRNYVTVDSAIAAANADSTIDEITLFGENTVLTSATVPAIKFTFDDASTVLNIGDEDNRDVRLEIAADATYGRTGNTEVYGTLYFNDRTDMKVSPTEIHSDVVSYEVGADGKEVKNGWAKFTNIYTAMTEANSGDIITVKDNRDVELDSDFTVKEGVTLVIPDGSSIEIKDGVTLTVAGTLQSNAQSQGIVAQNKFGEKAVKSEIEPETNCSAIVVTGVLKVIEDRTYSTDNPTTTLASGSFISGAYYSDGEYNYVTPLSIAVSDAVLPTIMEGIDVYGTVSEGDTAFAATESCDTITVYGQLTLSSLTLSNEAVLKTSGTGWYSGTVTVGEASIEAVKVTGLTVDSDEGLVIDGATVKYIADGKEDKPENNEAVLTATAGTVIVDGTVVGKMTVAAGATLTVPSATTSDRNGTVNGDLVVDGTVSIGNGQTLNVDALYVTGTVTVAAQTDAAAAGAIVVGTNGSGSMYVGLDAKYNTTSETATVNGDVNCTTIYAAAGTTVTVDADVFARSTQYMVEGALWMTVFTQSDDVKIATQSGSDMNKAVPVENAYFDGTWIAENNEEITAADNKNVGDENCAVVTAKVKYDIYVINLRADQNAVSSVYIDGNIMQFGMIAATNTDGTTGYYYGYTATVSAGSHKIDYQLANGYSGNGVLTVNGTQMSGMTFTAEGNPTTGSTVPYELQLSGFEKSGYVPDSPDTPTDSGDDGMSITDILLIVLVVLIIIMAIIVAVRLMRS